MKYHYLFDNNIYRPLMNSKNGEFLQNFKKSIKKNNIITNIPLHNIAYSVTPFSIIEALGVSIPYPENLISNKKLKIETYKEDFISLSRKAEIHFKNLEILKIENLLNNAKEQSKYTDDKSKELEKKLIINPLNSEGFYNYLLKGLVFDFLCKYQFPLEIQKRVFSEYLIPTFFLNDREISRFSKFRIIKRLWDNSYYELEKSRDNKKIIRELNQSMKLKRNKDFLDCEIIHFSSIGDLVNKEHNPVISFTLDKKETVVNRLIVYKSMVNLFLNKLLTTEQYEENEHIIKNWKQGMIVFCDNKGNFTKSIDVSNINTIY
ncbi:hypothetical protein [Psychroflexus aestuariivivens]|uniref:hypothetical protein n=1 Tax=Psychroflexus aestuariivivens TaxID=1795040 RepID=UPI000FDC67A5|nr:hypothetical protein [Psychroflexus aestuariivivens]